MPDSNRNRKSEKGNNKENRTGENPAGKPGYRKLPDDPGNRSDESISTRDDSANGKYSCVGKRDEDIDNDNTRGGD